PKLYRVSPMDIVFNPIASDFASSPKIIRTIKSLGELKKDLEANPDDEVAKAAFDKALKARRAVQSAPTDSIKDNGFMIDVFSSFQHYFSSGMVEILSFYGDLYDVHNDKLYENHEIIIVDRCFVAVLRRNPNWLGREHIFHH